MPEGESENLFFKTPPGRRLSIWGAAILAAVAQERDPPYLIRNIVPAS